ncbi:flagellar hook-associated protein FlgK [bacterium]|nr:flagellar hook-associated protein FlgK [bacterium]
MIVGLRSIFDIGRKGLKTNLAGLDVTGNNIANVNTEGYSRQKIQFKPSYSHKTPYGIFGTGAEIEGINRVRDAIVDRQIRTQSSPMGEYEVLENLYTQIENIFSEPNAEYGIRTQIERLFNSFHELANDPESGTARNVVYKQAQVLSEVINIIDQQLTILSDDIGLEINQKTTEINNISARIASLNIKIASAENNNASANQLRDERDLELDRLSKISNVYYNEESSGSINVSIGSNSVVSDGFRVSTLTATDYNDNGEIKTKVTGTESGVEFIPRGGELKALMAARNTILPGYRENLNLLASTLITQVNAIHRNGVGLQGSLSEVPHDNDFFTGTDAGDIDVSDAIKSSVNNIAAAERNELEHETGEVEIWGSPGDNTIALQLANLKNVLVLESNTESFDDYLAMVIGGLGVEARDAKDSASRQEMVVTQFKNLRDSTSGVSLDEELTYLIQFQRGYQAASRIITTVDEMFTTLINM